LGFLPFLKALGEKFKPFQANFFLGGANLNLPNWPSWPLMEALNGLNGKLIWEPLPSQTL